ncbi:hypothetical protein L2E82_45659 [Cichorium intybus]|uniref:Uncharacterized protein n=1 Tax=Cichorium intybus TaxID=13427 RepID=A0ACB8ZSN2_CICIN|nr:hypothetical protein L2E82_45659 [Cichorium intybus]
MNLVPLPVNRKMLPSTDESTIVSGLSIFSHVIDWATDSLPPLISSFTVTISKPNCDISLFSLRLPKSDSRPNQVIAGLFLVP